MFSPGECHNQTVVTEMSQSLEWINHQIERCKAEIMEQELAVKSREPVIAQQNFDLQDAFSRYISLSKKQCEKQIKELMSQTADELTEKRTLRVDSKIATAAFLSDDIEKSISELKQQAESAEHSLSKMHAVANAVANRGTQIVDQITQSRTNQLTASTIHSLTHQTATLRKQKTETTEQIIAKMEEKNRLRVQLEDQLVELKRDFSLRIERLAVAVGTLGDRITTASRQSPRPQLDLQTSEIISIEPLSVRQDNLVIMAPISTRRSMRSDSMFFRARSFFQHANRY